MCEINARIQIELKQILIGGLCGQRLYPGLLGSFVVLFLFHF